MSPASPLQLSIRHHAGTLSLEVDLRLDPCWTVLFGPSGSGKTTVLRAVAGLLRPNAGRITAGEKIYFDAMRGIFVPPHQRGVRCAMQGGRLFPNRTVIENILYGSGWASGSREATDLTRQVMTSFHIAQLADRNPRQLSGGEQQRACVARALVAAITFDPRQPRPLLLLDEPLTGLDLAVRDDMIAALQRWTGEHSIPVLSVTHSVGEAFQLGAEVIRLSEGRVQEAGIADVVLDRERRHLLRLLDDPPAVSQNGTPSEC